MTISRYQYKAITKKKKNLLALMETIQEESDLDKEINQELECMRLFTQIWDKYKHLCLMLKRQYNNSVFNYLPEKKLLSDTMKRAIHEFKNSDVFGLKHILMYLTLKESELRCASQIK